MIPYPTPLRVVSSGSTAPPLYHRVDRPMLAPLPLAAGLATEPPARFGAGDGLEAGGAAAG